jgi:hypothetical protein
LPCLHNSTNWLATVLTRISHEPSSKKPPILA